MRIKSLSIANKSSFYDELFKVNILCDEILRALGIIEYAIMSIEGNEGKYGKYLTSSVKEVQNDISEAKECIKNCIKNEKAIEDTFICIYKKNELTKYTNSIIFDDIVKSYSNAIESADRTIKNITKINNENISELIESLDELKRRAENVKEKLLDWKSL